MKVNDDMVYNNFIRLLSKFIRGKVELTEENKIFLSIQQYMEKELASVEEGAAKYNDDPFKKIYSVTQNSNFKRFESCSELWLHFSQCFGAVLFPILAAICPRLD